MKKAYPLIPVYAGKDIPMQLSQFRAYASAAAELFSSDGARKQRIEKEGLSIPEPYRCDACTKALEALAGTAFILLGNQKGEPPYAPDELAAALKANCTDELYRMAACYFVASAVGYALSAVLLDDIDYESIDPDEFFHFDTSAAMSRYSDPVRRKLEYYKNRLLDFSRNNQLVHYRRLKTATLDLTCGNLRRTVKALENGHPVRIVRWGELKKQPEQILRCRLCGRYAFRPYTPAVATAGAPCHFCDANNTHGRKSMTPVTEGVILTDCDTLTCSCGENIQRASWHSEFPVCPSCGKAIEFPSYPLIDRRDAAALLPDDVALCGTSDKTGDETAAELVRRARSLERNFGLHALYLACGFLDWQDANGTPYHSPLLLCRVTLHYDRADGSYNIEPDTTGEETFAVNKTLLCMLSMYSQSISVPLPAYDGMGYSYFAFLRRTWEEAGARVSALTDNWKITEGVGLGFFHYQKLQLEQDLEQHEDVYLAHPMIRRLCGDETCALPVAEAAPDDLPYTVLDADSSQSEVIEAARSGRSFILQGPPGSGKSQTITNIIADAMGTGKSVLFVTEKATARHIISDNLRACDPDPERSLCDFVLDFDSFSTRRGAVGKEPLIAEVNRATAAHAIGRNYTRSLHEEETAREAVAGYMEQIVRRVGNVTPMTWLEEAAPFADCPDLDSFSHFLPQADSTGPDEVLSAVGDFYAYAESGRIAFDLASDPLFHCAGDASGELIAAAETYRDRHDALRRLFADAAGKLSLPPLSSGYGFPTKWSAVLTDFADMPALPESLSRDFSTERLRAATDRAEKRAAEAEAIAAMPGADEAKMPDDRLFDLITAEALAEKIASYSCFLRRIGRGYKQFAASVLACSREEDPHGYAALCRLGEAAALRSAFLVKREAFRAGYGEDESVFGRVPETPEEWRTLANDLKKAGGLTEKRKNSLFDCDEHPAFMALLGEKKHAPTADFLHRTAEEMRRLQSEKVKAAQLMLRYFDKETRTACAGHAAECGKAADLVLREQSRLPYRRRVSDILGHLEKLGLGGLIAELHEKQITSLAAAERIICRNYFCRALIAMAQREGLDRLQAFDRAAHEAMLSRYAKADRKVLSEGAARLYDKLTEEVAKAAKVYAEEHHTTTDLPHIPLRRGQSVRQMIAENPGYIHRLKPCFMMSPLSASQYIDIGTTFDLVIFDEASQIFVEDALASIVRAKQVIIAGDSKQLPPCDFFRAGESNVGEADVPEDEDIPENAILTAAERVLGEASLSLLWHYRSHDEALIAFSNREMDYRLITFPSAVKNPDDGICSVRVPYDPRTCYVSGKSRIHINPGEADAIVGMLWEEINHPTRRRYSLGVVAFSVAQAAEIEKRWNRFREMPEHIGIVEAWEHEHPQEPILFCNLDTMQGDERDTMILSVCYSRDAEGRFSLPYLGQLRLSTGKKRLNVAVTRSRHRMVVVSTLEPSTLREAIDRSAAPAENKEGAEMLLSFLEYASSVDRGTSAAVGATRSPIAASVCRVLDEAGIAYDTEIGRSACRINIGIKDPMFSDTYLLGIIIDDPRRGDFDSPREYARLTGEVLGGKYKWKLYRVYPAAWLFRFREEKDRLLAAVYEALDLRK